MSKRFTKDELENLAKVELLLRHVRNLHQLGPHQIRSEATDANQAFERALGADYSDIFKTKIWKNA